MLEVGRVAEPQPGTFHGWNRAHFGAWAIVSAPLILGLELTDEKLDPVLDIITNKEAIAVNQAWAGHPGMLVENYMAPPVPYSPDGATVPSSSNAKFWFISRSDPDVSSGAAPPVLRGTRPSGARGGKKGSGAAGGG